MELDTELALESKFASFAQLDNAIKKFEESYFVKLYRKDSRTIASFRKRCPKRPINEELVYSQLIYTCIHGGKKFKSRSTGKQINTRTFKQDCPMKIVLKASEDGKNLVVTNMVKEHNHPVSQMAYSHLPSVRRLDEKTKEAAQSLLTMKANKKMVQKHVFDLTGKRVTLRDLSNLKIKDKRKNDRNDLRKLFHWLQGRPGSITEMIIDDDDNLLGIYYQDQRMRQMFSAFPEIFFVDATHKLNEFRMPLFVMMVEDGNGESDVTALFLAASEEEKVISEMVKTFKKHNANWEKIDTIITDKEFNERKVLHQALPQAKLQICLFHVSRTFRREINCEKLGITIAERVRCLELITSLVYARSEEEYEKKRQELHQTRIASVVQYFEENWHPIRDEWVEGLKTKTLTFLNRTNNRLESINQKIKDVCTKFTSLEQCFSDIFVVLNSLATERDCRALEVTMKRTATAFQAGSPESRFADSLTPYSFSYVLKQLQFAANVKDVVMTGQGEGMIRRPDKTYSITCTSCDCSFFTSMSLPCRHIFALRSLLGMPLYDEQLIPIRWSKKYYVDKHHVYKTNSHHLPSHGSITEARSPPLTTTVKSAHQKYREAFDVSKKLATLVSEMPMRQYLHSINTLKIIESAWQNNRAVCVQIEGEESSEDEQILPVRKMRNEDPATSSELMSIAVTDSLPAERSMKLSASTIKPPLKSSSTSSTKPQSSESSSSPSTKPRPSETSCPPSAKPQPSETSCPPSTKPRPPKTSSPLSTTPLSSDNEECNLRMNEAIDQEFIDFISSNIKDLTEKEIKSVVAKPHISVFMQKVASGDIMTPLALLHKNNIRMELQSPNWGAFTDDQLDAVKEGIKSAIYSNETFIQRYNNVGFELEVLLPDCLEMILEDLFGISEQQANYYFSKYTNREETKKLLAKLSRTKLPCKNLKRGRPKGSERTTIGTIKKRKQSAIQPFVRRQPAEKDKVILNWFVEPAIVLSAIDEGTIIDARSIKKGPVNVTSAILEEDANVERVERFFSTQAWKKVKNLIHLKEKQGYACFVCRRKVYTNDSSIRCDGCLEWGHFECAGIKKRPKRTFWYCSECRKK